MGFLTFTKLRKWVFGILSGVFFSMMGIAIFALHVMPILIYEYHLTINLPEFIRTVMFVCVFFVAWGPIALFGWLGIGGSFLEPLGHSVHAGFELTWVGWLFLISFYFILSLLLSWPANLRKDKS